MAKGERLDGVVRWGKRLAVTAAVSGGKMYLYMYLLQGVMLRSVLRAGIIYAGWRIYSRHRAEDGDEEDEDLR